MIRSEKVSATAETSKFPTTCPAEVPCSPSLRGNGSAGSCAARPKAARNAATSSRNNTKLQIKVHKQAACVNETKMIFSNNRNPQRREQQNPTIWPIPGNTSWSIAPFFDIFHRFSEWTRLGRQQHPTLNKARAASDFGRTQSLQKDRSLESKSCVSEKMWPWECQTLCCSICQNTWKKNKTQKVALWTSIDAVPLWCSKHLQETVGHCIGSVVIVFQVR